MLAMSFAPTTIFCLAIVLGLGVNDGQASSTNRTTAGSISSWGDIKLLNAIGNDVKTNIVYSPVSLFTAFEMLLHGARGKTAKELQHLLGYKDKQTTRGHYQAHRVMAHKQKGNGTTVLDVANSILVKKGLGLVPKFKLEMQTGYQALIDEVDSRDVAKVNDWVKEKTHGKIEHLVDSLDDNGTMVVLSAVYFKGLWSKPFNREMTEQSLFHGMGQNCPDKKVPMMRKTMTAMLADTKLYQMLHLPYSNGSSTFSMVVLLPKHMYGLPVVEKDMSMGKFWEVQAAMRPRLVDVHLPRFKVDFKRDVASAVRRVGAPTAFTDKADFSGIAKNVGSVGRVFHQAVIEVNEEGTEAAAATAVRMYPMSLPVSRPAPVPFVADHPFLFAVVEGKDILFIGHYQCP